MLKAEMRHITVMMLIMKTVLLSAQEQRAMFDFGTALFRYNYFNDEWHTQDKPRISILNGIFLRWHNGGWSFRAQAAYLPASDIFPKHYLIGVNRTAGVPQTYGEVKAALGVQLAFDRNASH